MTMPMQDRIQVGRAAAIARYFESLAPADIARLGDFYASDARFKDPFNQVQGIDAIAGVYRHMFTALDTPRFTITNRIVDGTQLFLVWEFSFRFRRFHAGKEQKIHGGSHLVLDEAGLISLHRDYWDAAEELYEKLPLLGSLMRWLKKRANS
jgi:ketosteroid isomerase-like protein